MLNAFALNTTALNVGVVPTADTDYTSSIGKPYRLEIRNSAGVLQCFVSDWYGATWSQSYNAPDTLGFTVPGDSDCAAYILPFYEIWLYQGDATAVRQRFQILAYTSGNAGKPWITVECEDMLGKLGRELVTSLFITAGTDIRTAITSLFTSHQYQSPTVYIGVVDGFGDIEAPIDWNNKSILACLNDIQEITGGYFWIDVDSDGVCWLRFRVARRSINLGHWIRLDHNATDIRERVDARELRTRMIGITGAGGRQSVRTTVTLNDSTAQSTYGVIPGIYNATNVTDTDTLTYMAQNALNTLHAPKKTYQVGVIDLSQLDSTSYSFEQYMMFVGQPVRLLCTYPTIDIDTHIMSIQRNLDTPADVQISIGSPETGSGDWGISPQGAARKDVLDHIVDAKARNEDATRDTGLVEQVGEALENETDTQESLALGLEAIYDTGSGTTYDTLQDTISEFVTDELETASGVEYEALRDAIADAIIDVLDNGTGEPHDSITDAISDAVAEVLDSGSGTAYDTIVDAITDEANKWVEYTA